HTYTAVRLQYPIKHRLLRLSRSGSVARRLTLLSLFLANVRRVATTLEVARAAIAAVPFPAIAGRGLLEATLRRLGSLLLGLDVPRDILLAGEPRERFRSIELGRCLDARLEKIERLLGKLAITVAADLEHVVSQPARVRDRNVGRVEVVVPLRALRESSL